MSQDSFVLSSMSWKSLYDEEISVILFLDFLECFIWWSLSIFRRNCVEISVGGLQELCCIVTDAAGCCTVAWSQWPDCSSSGDTRKILFKILQGIGDTKCEFPPAVRPLLLQCFFNGGPKDTVESPTFRICKATPAWHRWSRIGRHPRSVNL